jgi:hypothetical protein
VIGLGFGGGGSGGGGGSTPDASPTVKGKVYEQRVDARNGFGITFDGSTDDTAGLAAAIAAAGNGGRLWIPKGPIKVSQEGTGRGHCLDISTLSGITIEGPGGALMNPSGTGAGACIFTTDNAKIIKCEGAALNHRGPTIRDLRLETRGANGTCFSLLDYNHYVFERVAFQGVGQGGSAASIGLRIEGTGQPTGDASYGQVIGCQFHRHLAGLRTVNSVGLACSHSYFDSDRVNHILYDIQGGSAISMWGAKFQCNRATGSKGVQGGTPGGTIGGDWEFIANNFEGCPFGIDLMDPAASTLTETVVMGNSFTGTNAAIEPELSGAAVRVGTNRKHDYIAFNRYRNVATTIIDNGVNTFQIAGRVEGAQTGEFMRMAGVSVHVVTGTPEGAVIAAVGSLAVRKDGGASTTLYVKQSGAGNTGWVAK